jgi:2'-hydroxyisoflavone reductase
MKLLILGGTRFVGRHMVEAALREGHEVTLFNRGQSNPDLFLDIEKLIGDRDGGLAPLEGRQWDAVIDVNGYIPRLVNDSAQLLKDVAEHYIFISTGAVYERPVPWGYDESHQVETVEDESSEDVRSHYGALKVLCEQKAEAAFPGRTLVMRLGLVCGPYDNTDRVTYWVCRAARGGEMFVPGSPDDPIQVVDGRDLAAFAMLALRQKITGVYNTTGRSMAWRDWLETFRSVSGSDTQFIWINDRQFLDAHKPDPQPSGGAFPLVFPDSWGPWWSANSDQAQRLGLNYKSMTETAISILEENQTRSLDSKWEAGLTLAQEQAMLKAWAAHSK